MGRGFESLKVHQNKIDSFDYRFYFCFEHLIEGVEGREVGGIYRAFSANLKKYIDTLSEYCYNMITDILSE